jgi:hypothetical protein
VAQGTEHELPRPDNELIKLPPNKSAPGKTGRAFYSDI